MHGSMWRELETEHDQAMVMEKNDPVGNRAAPMAPQPTADNGHRASSRPSSTSSGAASEARTSGTSTPSSPSGQSGN